MSNCTIKDVALAAGVSISTVSRVINGGYPVSEEKRLLVEKAIADLNFARNSIAAGLRSSKSNTIGMVVPRFTNATYAQIISGVEKRVKETGCRLLIASSGNDRRQEKEILDSFRESKVQAIILASSNTALSTITDIIDSGIPVVLIDRKIERARIDCVTSDDEEASYKMIQYLLDIGHRKIAIVKGVNSLSITKDRLTGYLKAIADYGITPEERLQLDCDFTTESAYSVMSSFLARTPAEELPSAVFATSTSILSGVLSAILDAGLTVPEDISISSFGEPNIPAFFRPQITCIARYPELIGEKAGMIALQRMEEYSSGTRRPPETIIIHSDMRLGTSVKELSENAQP